MHEYTVCTCYHLAVVLAMLYIVSKFFTAERLSLWKDVDGWNMLFNKHKHTRLSESSVSKETAVLAHVSHTSRYSRHKHSMLRLKGGPSQGWVSAVLEKNPT